MTEGSGLFDTPVTVLRGVSGKRAATLARLSLVTLFDLITHFPRAYEDWSDLKTISQLTEGEDAVFVARVARQPSLMRKGRLSVLRTVLRDETAAVKAVWFNQPYLAEQLQKDAVYVFRGRIRRKGLDTSVQNPSFEKEQPEADKPQIRPVYRLTTGLSQGVIRGLVDQSLRLLVGHLPEPLPDDLRRAHQLCAVDFAYSRIHHPASIEEAEICRRRLAFEEMFLIQAGLRLLRRRSALSATACPILLTPDTQLQFDQVVDQLPFTLTRAQQKAVQEVLGDLSRPVPMNRLVQGDVGSGKTVVAALALLATALAGLQGVLMAPTAILAEQHARTLSQFLGSTGIEIALLTGATKAAERKRILAGLQDGSIRILVGTHAVIEDRVQFKQLALAVTDEQHRFGVRQRTLLAVSAPADTVRSAPPDTVQSTSPDTVRSAPPASAHVLVMSATPIPRTLALILYGDLDLSIINEKPAGRQPIKTYTATSRDRERLDHLIRREVSAGRKVFVVCPQIEESEMTDEDPGTPSVKNQVGSPDGPASASRPASTSNPASPNGLMSAEAAYARLHDRSMPDLPIGLIHGDMKAKEKQQIMEAFTRGEIRVLVATTVIEVGVDQPEATLMIIENAERFGLSQLHQLRGRIGRGSHPSICVLVSDCEGGIARERLRTLCHHDDGFLLAEKDLELRGPGDFFGTRQHGIPDFHAANLYQDTRLLKEVQESLDRLLDQDPDLSAPPNRRIVTALQARYRDVFPNIGL